MDSPGRSSGGKFPIYHTTVSRSFIIRYNGKYLITYLIDRPGQGGGAIVSKSGGLTGVAILFGLFLDTGARYI